MSVKLDYLAYRLPSAWRRLAVELESRRDAHRQVWLSLDEVADAALTVGIAEYEIIEGVLKRAILPALWKVC